MLDLGVHLLEVFRESFITLLDVWVVEALRRDLLREFLKGVVWLFLLLLSHSLLLLLSLADLHCHFLEQVRFVSQQFQSVPQAVDDDCSEVRDATEELIVQADVQVVDHLSKDKGTC